jgi:hypothetical protein
MVGLRDGDLAHVRDGNVEVYQFKHSEQAFFEQLLPQADGSVLGATSYGLIEWRNGRTSTLSRENGLPCEQVYGAVFDRRGDLWLYMNCALGVLKRADLEGWRRNPATVVTIRTFGALDGVRPLSAAFGSGQRSPDGRLWFANSSSLQFFDLNISRETRFLRPCTSSKSLRTASHIGLRAVCSFHHSRAISKLIMLA